MASLPQLMSKILLKLDADTRVTAHRKNPDTKQLAWTWKYERKVTLKWLECDQTLPLKLLAGKMFSQTHSRQRHSANK